MIKFQILKAHYWQVITELHKLKKYLRANSTKGQGSSMQLLTHNRNVYGQQTLEGISFELVSVSIRVATVIIVGHLLFKLLTASTTVSSLSTS
jgi:hypothetical protein